MRIISRIAARDIRSNLGEKLDYRQETGLDPWLFGNRRIKEELVAYNVSTVPSTDNWRIDYVSKLLMQRQVASFYGDDKVWTETNELLHTLVTS